MSRRRNSDRKGCCRLSWCCAINVIGLTVIAAVLIWYFAFFAKDVEEYKSAADCGGCYCIPDNTTSMECPTSSNNNNAADALPKSYYPEESINVWQSQTILNPYQLTCNPYKDSSDDGGLCDTEPPLNQEYVDLGDTAVCAIHFEDGTSTNSNSNSATCKENNIEGSSYRIKTYPSKSDAESAGGYVTHIGHCGVCSTLQDLAVYANIDFVGLTSPGNFCRRQASSKLENGLSCYRDLGFTLDCAKIWADTSWNTASNCFRSCILPTVPVFGGAGDGGGDGLSATLGNVTGVNINVTNFTDPSPDSDDSSWMNDLPGASTIQDLSSTIKEKFFNLVDSTDPIPVSPNGPAPDCAMNECLVCNEKESGAVFDKFAGRSRRNSGLVSTVAYPCGNMPNIVQDPCPSTEPLTQE